MFRVKESEVAESYSLAERVVQATLLLAFLANCVCLYLIFQELRQLGAWFGEQSPVSMSSLASLQREVEWQFLSGVIVSVVLLSCFAAIWWLGRRYLSSQRSLRQVKILAHDILASMDRGIVTINREGIITSINSAAIRLLEVDFECVGQSLASISPTTIPLADISERVVTNQVAIRDRDVDLDRAGRRLRLRIDGHALRDIQGTALGSVLHLRDVTERMLLEERMHRMERFLGLATLASGLHHEIKNPLTALSIHIQLLEESLATGRDGDSIDEVVSILKTEVCRLNGVLETFRSFANLQSLNLQPTNPLDVIEESLRLIRPQAVNQGVQITLLQPETALPKVPLDAEKFEQAILNLVINALEAMPEGGHLTLSAWAVDGQLHVVVQDSGPGIPAEVQRNVFQPYFSTKSTGSGMGLALTEKLLGQHGGHVTFITGPQGTDFKIVLPLLGPNEGHA
jgi:two-component system sensor histidine kinase HydH